ncbi:MAG TPA: ATP-binding protein, partial [Steroidobacteraceae bacterium]|nr:ATP-binding protein [Steroidobacteraceae bacterium]
MKRLLPSTMFGRLAASLVLVVGIMLAVMVALIMRDRAELSMRVGGVGDSSHRIAYLTRELAALHGDARAAERKRLSADVSLQVEPDRYPNRTLNRHEVAAIGRAFVAELRDRLGDSYKITLDRIWRSRPNADFIHLVPERRRASGTNALDVTVAMPDGDSVVFRVAAPLPDPPLPWALFIQIGVLTVVLAAVLFLVTRSITRPLSKLALAADAVGKSVRHPPLVEEGVREIRDATRAFNTMQDRLLRYLDSRTSVLAAMSHDLRTPLTRLRLRVEAVADERLHARFSSDLDEMEALVWSALALFKGLDDDEKFEAVDVNALLATFAVEYAELGKPIAIEGKAQEALQAKPRALKRCLGNLVDNALKFGRQAAIQVEDGETLAIRVADDGPGIPEEMLERVFEPFYRLESSRSRDTGGAGLGLSIARDVAQAHGGSLTLRNRPEGGLIAELRL